MTTKKTTSLSISSWDFGRSVDWFCSVCALNIKQIFDISWCISLNFSYQIMRRPVDWPKALQSLSGFLKKSWRAPVRHHSTCSVIKKGCHFLLHIIYWCFICESYILKLDEANETVLWFRKLNLNYLWDLIQKLNSIYILDSGKTSIEKKRFLSGIARMRGGVYPCPNFLASFSRSAFLVNKKSLFLQKCQCIELLTVF